MDTIAPPHSTNSPPLERVVKNAVVSLDLSVFELPHNTCLEATPADDYFSYLHGQGTIIPKLENALDNLAVGDQVEIDIDAIDAYGEYIDDATVQIPRDNIDSSIELRIGAGMHTQSPNGTIELYIRAFDDNYVTLDANHPYAGKRLRFCATVMLIRQAHHDEIWHRRVHPGGHHLMISDSSFTGNL